MPHNRSDNENGVDLIGFDCEQKTFDQMDSSANDIIVTETIWISECSGNDRVNEQKK